MIFMGLPCFSDDLHEIFTGIFMEFIPVGAKVPNDSSWIFYFKMGLNQQPDYSINIFLHGTSLCTAESV